MQTLGDFIGPCCRCFVARFHPFGESFAPIIVFRLSVTLPSNLFGQFGSQQILIGLQRASHNLACPGAPSYHENSCGVWAIISTTHTISPRIKRGCRRRLDVTALERFAQMPLIPPQDRKAAGPVGQKSPLSRH